MKTVGNRGEIFMICGTGGTAPRPWAYGEENIKFKIPENTLVSENY